MYRIVYTRQATKELLRLPRKVVELVREKLEAVAQDPHASHPNVTKLQNRSGFRLRVGDWRVIYEIHDDRLVVLVLKIAKRGEVYR